jgi:hypothetical protein
MSAHSTVTIPLDLCVGITTYGTYGIRIELEDGSVEQFEPFGRDTWVAKINEAIFALDNPLAAQTLVAQVEEAGSRAGNLGLGCVIIYVVFFVIFCATCGGSSLEVSEFFGIAFIVLIIQGFIFVGILSALNGNK